MSPKKSPPRDQKTKAPGRPDGAISTPKEIPAEHLAEFLKQTKEDLRQLGVSTTRLPTNKAITSHLAEWVDPEKVKEWKNKYAAAEADPPGKCKG